MAMYLLLLLVMHDDPKVAPDMTVIPIKGFEQCNLLGAIFLKGQGDGPVRHAACLQANEWGETAQG